MSAVQILVTIVGAVPVAVLAWFFARSRTATDAVELAAAVDTKEG